MLAQNDVTKAPQLDEASLAAVTDVLAEIQRAKTDTADALKCAGPLTPASICRHATPEPRTMVRPPKARRPASLQLRL